MIDLQKKNDREKLMIYTMLKDLDTGKAIVAAIVVGVIGYIAAILTKLYMFAYWGVYFEFYNIPFEYFDNTEIFTANVYAILISFLISFLYLFVLNRYYNYIAKYDKGTKQNHFTGAKIIKFVVLILFPATCVSILFFYILIFTNGGFGYIGTMVCISSIILTILTTIFYGFYMMRTSYGSNKTKKSIAFSVENSLPITTMIITVLVFTLSLVYLFGYFQTVIDLDIPQSICVDGEESDKQYVLLLNMKDAYFCVPVEYEGIEGDEDGDYFMHLKNDSYRIVPKDTSVTIFKSDAWLVRSEHGDLWLSDIIGDNEEILGLAMLSCIVVMILLLFLESRCLIVQSVNE